ncbi:two-component system regulatory protein YycI [Bacillus sp. B15-48]|uniref:two-component system regulatory protein YycI n=1 Tax=Bacillus sp. B15-48 TaxID=1548601 RepID=UPI00193FA0AA|nr:two-component system regulatory protein YycI [Bacillus sp. B15-48]MBM4761702.1 hypothetical protein [Bacillus sp. B15-48]
MDWGKIKTIFIISFLLLDIYLIYQFVNTRSEAKYEVIKEATIDERLKNDDIVYGELPQELGKERYISVKPKTFTEVEPVSNVQKFIDHDGTMIFGKFEEPIPVDEKFNTDDFSVIVKAIVEYGGQYRFWKKDDIEGTITYYQLYDGKMMYRNRSGKLTFYFNENNEVTSYEQTFIEEIEEMSEEQEVLTSLGAIEILYKKGMLKPRSEITKIEFGYSTLIQLAASQVLAPTWRIVVNEEEDLFVHAFEGQVIQFNDEETEITE